MGFWNFSQKEGGQANGSWLVHVLHQFTSFSLHLHLCGMFEMGLRQIQGQTQAQ